MRSSDKELCVSSKRWSRALRLAFSAVRFFAWDPFIIPARCSAVAKKFAAIGYSISAKCRTAESGTVPAENARESHPRFHGEIGNNAILILARLFSYPLKFSTPSFYTAAQKCSLSELITAKTESRKSLISK